MVLSWNVRRMSEPDAPSETPCCPFSRSLSLTPFGASRLRAVRPHRVKVEMGTLSGTSADSNGHGSHLEFRGVSMSDTDEGFEKWCGVGQPMRRCS